jgi:hypothetical protein
MHTDQIQSCIAACKVCAVACDDCADNALHASNVYAMEECMALAIDCAEICRLAIGYLERERPTASAICKACVDVCERCQAACDTYQMGYCRACAEACRECAETCRMLIAHVDRERHSHDSVLAGLRQ